ncbi:MAG: prepilin-type N-terminal cleavage/methylation domain-containing protein [Candidatus Buchananbacteria bacterium]|nr:prepilin-type N-terminal cleavage/methylation domain-containing protein [Candidatus Buchananbacteria bacterium]
MKKLAKCSEALLKNKDISVRRYKLGVKRFGFSLAEVVVVIGIFAIASVIIAAVYFNANNLHRNTANYQRLQNDGRYMVEKIAREIRAREIEYPIEQTQPQDYIQFLKDELGNNVSITKSTSGNNLEYSVNGLAANLNADDVEVIDAKFYIIPTQEDKWNTEPITNSQLRVIIFLKLKNKSINPAFQKEITIQTTISSRVYKR